MDNMLVKDTFEVIIENPVTGNRYNYALTDSAGLSSSMSSELLRGGLGNFVVEKMFTDRTWTLDVETVLFNQKFLALQNSSIDDFTTGSSEVMKTEEHTIVDNSGSLEVTLDETETIINDDVDVVLSRDGDIISSTYDSGSNTVTLTGDVVEGDEVTAMFKVSASSAETLVLGKTDFPSEVTLYLHSIAYKENVKVGDIYIKLNRCSPDGNVDLSFSSGENTTTSVSFDVLADGSKGYGEYTFVPVN